MRRSVLQTGGVSILSFKVWTPVQSRRFVASYSRLRITELLNSTPNDHKPQTVSITGFVRSIRLQKRVAFVAIGDGSTIEPLQAVLRPADAEKLSNGVAVSMTGEWVTSEGAGQSSELRVSSVKVEGQNIAATYPIQKKYQSPEFLRTIPHLRSRLPHNALLLRLRSLMIASVTKFFDDNKFVQTHTPVITSSDCEGAGEVFKVSPNVSASPDPSHEHISDSEVRPETSFFGSTKYLTVSGQLHLEALAQSVGSVWTLSPTFRAEKSDTSRHLSEFYMLEAETCFVKDLTTVMDLIEDMIRHIMRSLNNSNISKELQSSSIDSRSAEDQALPVLTLQQRWSGLTRRAWPRITYHDAIQRLQKAVSEGLVSFETPIDEDAGLSTEHERFLAEEVGQQGPLFVTDYPEAIKPFYMHPSQSFQSTSRSALTVACFDLLMPEVCEVAGGSLREHRLEPLQTAMAKKGLSLAQTPRTNSNTEEIAEDGSLEWYVDLRRYGSVPHGGFGLGFDRLLAYLAGVSNVRDVVAFPRWHGRCTC